MHYYHNFRLSVFPAHRGRVPAPARREADEHQQVHPGRRSARLHDRHHLVPARLLRIREYREELFVATLALTMEEHNKNYTSY